MSQMLTRISSSTTTLWLACPASLYPICVRSAWLRSSCHTRGRVTGQFTLQSQIFLYTSFATYHVQYIQVTLGDIGFWRSIRHFEFETDICDISILQTLELFRYFLDNLDFAVLVWYKINKITHYLNPIIPFHTNISQYCSQYRYSDIHFWCFSKPILQFFAKPIRYIGLLHSTRFMLFHLYCIAHLFVQVACTCLFESCIHRNQ